MSERKAWTAGPWRIWRDMDPKEPVMICGMETDFICQISGENTNAAANARLIAAAPEMAEALNGLLEHYLQLANCGDCGNWDPEKEAEVIAARAALAKAKGQSK